MTKFFTDQTIILKRRRNIIFNREQKMVRSAPNYPWQKRYSPERKNRQNRAGWLSNGCMLTYLVLKLLIATIINPYHYPIHAFLNAFARKLIKAQKIDYKILNYQK